MYNSPENEHSKPELTPGPAERRCVRRRLVQATLFPHKPQPQDREANDNVKAERDCVEIEDGEDDECCGSQSQSQTRRKRKPKAKSTPPEKASGKVNYMNFASSFFLCIIWLYIGVSVLVFFFGGRGKENDLPIILQIKIQQIYRAKM